MHKFVQDMYQDRFPELAGMVPEPIVYLKTVNILMNDIEKGKFNNFKKYFNNILRVEKTRHGTVVANDSDRLCNGQYDQWQADGRGEDGATVTRLRSWD